MSELSKIYSSRHTHSHPFLRKFISDYYYSGMGAVFVGTLCAIAMYMFYDTGYGVWDDWAGNFAGFFAIGVAWFPPSNHLCISWTGCVHSISAILLFGITIICCMIAIGIYYLLVNKGIWSESKFVLWVKSIALFAFGISWLTSRYVLSLLKKMCNVEKV